MPLTIEQQKALAVAQAKRKRAEAEAGPSLRSETDAIIEEAAAAIPGGYEAFIAKPPNAERMRAMGYVPDPLAPASTGGFSKPRAQPQQVVGPLTGDTSQPNVFTDVMRGLEAPIAGLTGGGLEGWAKTTTRDPVRGAVEAVDFISPVDDLGRAYQGVKQTGAGIIDNDMQKAIEGAQQASIDGSFAALQMLPGSMTLRGMAGPRNALAPTTLAGAERAAVQATRAPPVGKPVAQAAAPQPQPAPFSAPAEPKPSSFLRNNADRIAGGAVGGFLGSAGDAFAAEGDGSGGGPDIINPYTGAAAGMLGPRFAGQAWRAGRRASMPPAQRAAYDQRVAYKVLRNALAPAGITSAEQGIAAKIAQYGDKPASVVDLAQGNVGLAANLSRQQGATGEAALARGEQLLGGRAGRLERDIGQAAPGLNPGAITGDVDRMIALAQEQAKPAYDALRQQFPAGSVNSERLAKIEGIGSHIKAVDEYRAATAANEGRAVSDFEYWDLVKRDIDAKEQQLIAAGATMDDIRVRKLEGARAALVTELDDLMPGYAQARQLGGEAPKMREAFKQGQKLLDGNFLADEVSRMISEVTGQQLTATQAGVIRNMMKKTQNGRTAMAALMSSDARKKMEAVFGKEASDAMQARFAADAAIMTNAQRVSPNVGSVSAQALLGEGGGVQQAAELAQQAVAFKTNPLAAVLGALSRSGAYSQAQRDIMGELLLSDDVAGSLNRIFSNRPPRNPLNVEPPPTPQGPPTNALAPRRPEQAGFGGSKPPERKFANEAEADAEYARLAKQIDERRVELFQANVPRRQAYEEKRLTELQTNYKAKEQEIAAKMPQWEKDFMAKNASRYDEDTLKDRADDYAYAMYNRETAKLDTWRDKQENIISDKAYKLEERLDAQVEKWHDAQYEELNAVFDELDFDGARGNPEAIGAAGGTAIGMATAPDQNGDGVVDAQERMMGGAGGALTGGIAGRGVRALGGRTSAAAAGKFRGPSQQTFAGVNAKTADRAALGRAQNMEAEGAGRDAIWDATGWFKGVDGKWRFEIDDSRAFVKGGDVSASETSRRWGPSFVGDHSSGAMYHPELGTAYPALATDVTFGGRPGGGGQFTSASLLLDDIDTPWGGRVTVGDKYRGNEKTSVALHEGQHAVQAEERFARGGNPSEQRTVLEQQRSQSIAATYDEMRSILDQADRSVYDAWNELVRARVVSDFDRAGQVENFLAASDDGKRLLDLDWKARSAAAGTVDEAKAYESYKRLAGETEARNVETRNAMRLRGEKPGRPWETQDVPDDQQIVRFGGGKAESRPKGPPLNKLTPPR